MSLALGHLHAILATLTTAITAFPVTIFIGLRYAFVRPGVYVLRQLLACVFIRCLTTVLMSHCKITLLANLGGVTVLSILVRDMFN